MKRKGTEGKRRYKVRRQKKLRRVNNEVLQHENSRDNLYQEKSQSIQSCEDNQYSIACCRRENKRR